jgi:hypothetical protein
LLGDFLDGRDHRRDDLDKGNDDRAHDKVAEQLPASCGTMLPVREYAAHGRPDHGCFDAAAYG